MLAALNRPTIGFSACSVKRGESVSEIGYGSGAQSNGSRVVTYPQGFLRYGAGSGIEVDFIGPAYEIARSPVSTQSGLLDSGIGAKYEWFHDQTNVLAADFLYTVPSGAASFTAGAPVATVNLDYAWSPPSAFGFGTTVGFQSSYASNLAGASSRFFSLLPSAALTYQTNSRTQWYVEAFGQTRTRPDGGALFGEDGGLQYLLLPQLELDIEATRTVTDLVRAYSYGFGLGLKL